MIKKVFLIIIMILIICLTLSYLYIKGGNFFIDDYWIGLIFSIGILLITSLVGLIFWIILSRRKNQSINYFIAANSVGLLFLFWLNGSLLYQNWHYDRYQSNIDYNQSLTRQGGYLDTCMTIAQREIQRSVHSPNDFRILSYSYDLALSTMPRDTSSKFYHFMIIYSKKSGSELTTRVAKYLFNFRQDFKILYDVDIGDERANEVVSEYYDDINKFKAALQNIKDSVN